MLFFRGFFLLGFVEFFFLLTMVLTVSLVLGVCKAWIFFFVLFCDDFEWIVLLFFLGFLFFKKFFVFGFCSFVYVCDS